MRSEKRAKLGQLRELCIWSGVVGVVGVRDKLGWMVVSLGIERFEVSVSVRWTGVLMEK